MAEPELNQTRRSTGARRASAIAGLLIGFGIFAVLVLVVRATGDDEATPEVAAPIASEPAPIVVEPVQTMKIVFPEGFTREQMAKRIRAVNKIAQEERGLAPSLTPKEYRQATKVDLRPPGFEEVEAPNLEGFLFPATYEFTEETTTAELVDMQLAAFEREWGTLDLTFAQSRGLSPYDVLIIASMIEREVQVPQERELVSAVIYNRLELGLPLALDATIRYGLGIPANKAILESQLQEDTPYNTRLNPGLPPTPIANPGLASMEAAVAPADVDFLYFIRKADCKSHFFTNDESEFLNYPRDGLDC